MKVTLLKVIALATLLTVQSCWKKQQHDITAPRTPVYTLSGFVTDRDTGELMKDVIVRLIAVEMLYDYDFTKAVDTSNTDGSYTFEKITPGTYIIKGYRDRFPVIDEKIVIEHKNKQFDVSLPKYLLSRQSFWAPLIPYFYGICWKTPSTMAGTSFWKRFYDDPYYWSIMLGDARKSFERFGPAKYIRQNTGLYALAYLERFWSTDGESPQTTIYSIDPARGNIDGRTKIPFTIKDLTSDKVHLWATVSPGKIVKFGNHPSTVEQIYDINAQHPQGIAWDGKNIWIYDFTENLILVLNNELKTTTSYRPFIWDEKRALYDMGNDIRYMAFDFSGNLWAQDASKLHEFVLHK